MFSGVFEVFQCGKYIKDIRMVGLYQDVALDLTSPACVA